MKATFNEFITRVKTVGLPSPTHFHILIPGETKLNLMLCESITLPGFSVMTDENRIYGELTELPTAPIYNAVTATFIMDNNAQPRTFFIDWLNRVFNRNTRAIGYYADYVKDVDIFITNKAGGQILKTTLFECYPKSVQDVELSYSGDHLVKFTVSFIYKWASELREQTAGIGSLPGSGSQQNQLAPLAMSSQNLNVISNLPVGGIIASQTQGIQNSIVETILPGLIPTAQLTFDSLDLNADIQNLASEMNAQMGTAQNLVVDQISNLQNSILSVEQKELIQTAMLSADRDIRVLAESLSNLQQSNSEYQDQLNNKTQISNEILSLAQDLSGIEDSLNATGISVDLSSFVNQMQQISTNISTANQGFAINQQLNILQQVYQGAGVVISTVVQDNQSLDAIITRFTQIGDVIQTLLIDNQIYIDTFENKISIGDSIINLALTITTIQNMMLTLGVQINFSEYADIMQEIGLNIKLASQANIVNNQLSQFGSAFQSFGQELETASNKIPDEFTSKTIDSINSLAAQFMQTGLNIASLQATLQ